jgi:hypothetical protein
MHRPFLGRPADPPLALRALTGVVLLLAAGIVGRAQLDVVLPRIGLSISGAPPAADDAEGLGTTSSVTTIIARVDVHPARVCRGHDVVVEVALARGHETSAVAIQGRRGTRAVLRFARIGPHVVPIVARDPHAGVQVRQLRLNVEDCGAAEYPEVALYR